MSENPNEESETTTPPFDYPALKGPVERPEKAACSTCGAMVEVPQDRDEWDCENCGVTLHVL